VNDANRRTFLRGAGLLGAGAAVSVVTVGSTGLGAPASAEPSRGPDPESPRFTVVVMPDTQYLFDADRGDPAPLDASLRYVLDHAGDDNVVFLAHLGDLTQNGQPSEFAGASKSFEVLDRRRFPYSVLAGNHDIDSSTDDQRGPTSYLASFGPQRFRNSPSYRGSTKDGYNSYHVFRAGGREWLLLAMDWRPSAGGFAWAKSVLAEHPHTPAILTIHEFVDADETGATALSDFGKQAWDELVADSDQIFLTLNGHFWPPGRTVLRNNAGHDVHAHITNYQDRYYGGSAMIRMYRFDLARDVIDVNTFSPWLLGQAPKLNELQRLEIERTGSQDLFTLDIDFEARFAGFAPVPVAPPRPVRDLVVPGTVAYWRFDGGKDGVAVPDGTPIRDLSGHGNDLTRVTLPGSDANALTFSSQFHDGQPAHASLRFDGSKNPARGAYLRTVDSAPMNTATFPRGYTVEAFINLPSNFTNGSHGWAGLFGRVGTGKQAGKTGDDPSEPAVTLSLSDGAELQWAVFPTNQNGISTAWGHELPLGRWWHVAVVNDGCHTTMYVEGCPVLRNPKTPSIGLSNPGNGWMLGAYAYNNLVEQGFYGWIGDVRVVERALAVRDFMLVPALR
jgi:hypothetical protein